MAFPVLEHFTKERGQRSFGHFACQAIQKKSNATVHATGVVKEQLAKKGLPRLLRILASEDSLLAVMCVFFSDFSCRGRERSFGAPKIPDRSHSHTRHLASASQKGTWGLLPERVRLEATARLALGTSLAQMPCACRSR